MQNLKPENIPYLLLGQLGREPSEHGLSSDNQEITQELVTVYITTLYYSALANLYAQSTLPATLEEVDQEHPRLKTAIERSYADFQVAYEWLTRNGKEFVETSTAKDYYNEVLGLEKNTIKNISAFYS